LARIQALDAAANKNLPSLRVTILDVKQQCSEFSMAKVAVLRLLLSPEHETKMACA
jgi:hypothetical protein